MAAHQAPPSLGFSRQEHWSGLPFPSPMHESKKWKWSPSVVSDSSRPHGLQPTRLLRPWDFPGKSPGAGCHCLLWFEVLLINNYVWITGEAKWFSYTHTRIHYFSNYFPIYFVIEHWTEFPVLHSRPWLLIYLKYSCVYLTVLNSQSICPHPPFLPDHCKFILCVPVL